MAVGWQPATVLEDALLDAIQRGDQNEYLRLLAGSALLVPVRQDAHGQTIGWLTSSSGDRTFLLGYTSPESLGHAAGDQQVPYLTTTIGELARRWPDRLWWLAVNSGLPIEALIPPDSLPADDLPATPPAAIGQDSFVPANDVEEGLLDAARKGDSDGFLKALLLAELLILVTDGAGDLDDPHFPWPRTEVDGEPAVPLFTSRERLAERFGDRPYLAAPAVAVLRAWPDRAFTLALNSGTPVGASLPGPQVAELADWAAEVGLVAVLEDARLEESGVPTSGMTARQAPEPEPEQAAGIGWLQKLLPHEHVSFYQQRGYHLVSGFVHRLRDVGERVPPARLYRLLGLRGPAFTPADLHVHAVRWPAHGDGGYGDGGDGPRSEAVPQIRVAGVPLPHGALLCRIDRGGEETVVATYDADTAQWRTEEP